ncbi:hypothetical protein [Rhizobium sp. NFR07]|uniref:hypothetical protein n=1 Tax=Rhizobium sp. NFR07 TaxID=1566262 RepID=UPI000B874C8D|nr:hypothetical protein [Rhizobium sp. NFR07]
MSNGPLLAGAITDIDGQRETTTDQAGWRKVTIHNFKRKSRTGEMDKCDPISIFKDGFVTVTRS